jgi:uncharacterized protein YecE (DUF72 family)
MYYSRYEDDPLRALAGAMRNGTPRKTWCIFDNTAGGHAAGDAARLQDHIRILNATRRARG